MKQVKRIWMIAALLLFVLPANAISQDQSDRPAELDQGSQALAAKRYDTALTAFKEALKSGPDKCYECYRGLALAYMGNGDSKNALKNCEKAVASGTNSQEIGAAHYLAGRILLAGVPNEKALKNAETEFRAALQASSQYTTDARLYLGICLLRMMQDQAGLTEIQEYLQSSPNASDSAWARKIMENPRRAREPVAPDFAVKLLSGEAIALSQLSGKTVVLDFWATWCGPCRASLGELKELVKKYSGPNFELISFSADRDEKTLREFISKNEMTWRQYWDSDRKLARLFGVRAYPTYILIDGDGFIRSRIVGMNSRETIVHRLKKELESTTKNAHR